MALAQEHRQLIAAEWGVSETLVETYADGLVRLSLETREFPSEVMEAYAEHKRSCGQECTARALRIVDHCRRNALGLVEGTELLVAAIGRR